MRLRNTLMGAGALAVALLGGLWLFWSRSPAVDAVQEKCVKSHRAVLAAALIRLPEGVTWEEFEAGMLAFCECVGREAGRQLAPDELVAFVREQSTPAIEAKLDTVYEQCRLEP
jgi:hypothetical protein